MILKSSRILTEKGFINGYITIKGGKISNITEKISTVDFPVADVIDYGDYRIIPGIIDIHNHGFGGWSMTDPATVEDVKGFAKAVASVGVTTVLPTAKEQAFEAVAKCMDKQYSGARIHGIHSEGPFWARGGENTVDENYPLPDLDETKRLVELCDGKMVMMAIAPELPKAYEVIEYLHSQNIKVAAAHTKAYAQDIKDAMEKVGLDIVTHLCNGMRGIHHRDVGALGAYLLQDNLFYEIITDMNHICPDMIKFLFKIQPYSKFVMISDSNYIAGFPPGRYTRYNKVMLADEKGLIKDIHGRICGSGKYVLYNMMQLERQVGVPFEEISLMCSMNPAKFLGMDHLTGSIAENKLADITVIDDEYNCIATYVSGEKVYDCSKDLDVFKAESLALRLGDLP